MVLINNINGIWGLYGLYKKNKIIFIRSRLSYFNMNKYSHYFNLCFKIVEKKYSLLSTTTVFCFSHSF